LPRKATAAILAICAGAALVMPERAASAETLLQRGAYLTKSVAACGRCHTPRNAESQPIAGMEMAGGTEFDDADLGHVVAPNITPDPATGIGRWTQAQIVNAIRNGVRPDGTIIGPPMPFSAYDDLSDRDANAIAAYLRSIKPIRHAVANRSIKSRCPKATVQPSPMSRSRSARIASPMAPIWQGRSRIASAATRRSGKADSSSTASAPLPAGGNCILTVNPASWS